MIANDTINLDEKFKTRGGVDVSYNFNSDVLTVGKVDIFPEFFELFYDACKREDMIQLSLTDGMPTFSRVSVIKDEKTP